MGPNSGEPGVPGVSPVVSGLNSLEQQVSNSLAKDAAPHEPFISPSSSAVPEQAATGQSISSSMGMPNVDLSAINPNEARPGDSPSAASITAEKTPVVPAAVQEQPLGVPLPSAEVPFSEAPPANLAGADAKLGQNLEAVNNLISATPATETNPPSNSSIPEAKLDPSINTVKDLLDESKPLTTFPAGETKAESTAENSDKKFIDAVLKLAEEYKQGLDSKSSPSTVAAAPAAETPKHAEVF